MAQIYYKCEHCDAMFQAKKARKYCTSNCRYAAYYRRKRNPAPKVEPGPVKHENIKIGDPSKVVFDEPTVEPIEDD